MNVTGILVYGAIFGATFGASADAVIETNDLRIVVSDAGQTVSLFDRANQVEYCAEGQPAPLLRIRCEKQLQSPSAMMWNADKGEMNLKYGSVGVEAVIQVAAKPTHAVLELVRIAPLEDVDLVEWGPIPTTIKESVGEFVGVVKNDSYALGIQGLNVKTMGGFLVNEEGLDSSRGQAAKATEWGSTLQAYSRDRSRPRNADVWGGHFPNMPIPPIVGETVEGSKIVLFGCASNQALVRIGAIEVAEGLPHPEFDGVWHKMTREGGRSYLIASFSEADVDEMLAFAKRANLASLYHGGPFRSWGHYELNPRDFPNGNEGMKACVEKAGKLGIRIGVHTLSNFINTNDPYVSPVPDPRLAKTGGSVLTDGIDENAEDIAVASPEYFSNTKANWLRTVMIGKELIRYGAVSEETPWQLKDCQRGAFDTTPSAHAKGAEVAKLLDHPYKVIFPNYDMQHEVAVRLAEFFNETGVGHFDFDGHEGGWASGQGDFGPEMFSKVFYDHLERPVYNGSSNSRHFYWHINTTLNWGEPWYGGFRDSMADYRFNNQPLLERNFMPNMLGWFSMNARTTLADIEWMLARGAGYDAGFALATDKGSLKKNPQTGAILDAIREWEEARHLGAFSEAQRTDLRDPNTEFNLEAAGEDEWKLYPFHLSGEFVYEAYVRQPGEPTAVQWEWTNPGEEQPFQFRLDVEGEEGAFQKVAFEFDNYMRVEIPAEVKAGCRLVYDGSQTARIYDEKGRQAEAVELADKAPAIQKGAHTVEISGEFSGEPAPRVLVRFKTRGEAEPVKSAP